MRVFEDGSVEKAVGGIDVDGLSRADDETLEAVIPVRVADMPVNVSQNGNHMSLI